MAGIKTILFMLIVAAPMLAPAVISGDFAASYEVQKFISEMKNKHNFKEEFLNLVFSNAKLRHDILQKYRSPKKAGVAEAGSWQSYKKIMFTRKRLVNGIAFYQKHKNYLKRAEKLYGVPAEVIVAIIGIETYYGEHTGKDRVIDALSTIAFYHPPRAKYFTGELKNYLLMCRKQHKNPLKVKGSYAGAMGLAQFMPSSFRNYAVDFDENGSKDLMIPADAIGSIGNYLKQHGWRKGENIAFAARAAGTEYKRLKPGRKTNYSLERLAKYGVTPKEKVRSQRKSLIVLDGKNSPEVWIGGHNFYVITRYNNSDKYAMTVFKLARMIRQKVAG